MRVYGMDESQKKSVDVDILGQSIRIKHEDEGYVRELENFVSGKLEEIRHQQGVTNLQLAARVLLVVADEYFNAVKEKENVQEEIDNKAKRMIEFIEKKAALTERG